MTTLSLFDRPATPAALPPPAADEGSWLFDDAAGDPDGLWWFQREGVTAVFEQLKTKRSTLVVMATGLGKTTVFGTIAKHWPGRVLVLAHRDELVQQARKRIEHMTGEWVEVEQAEFSSHHNTRLVVGSVLSVCQQRRLERLGRDRFDLIVIDEAHHAVSASYRKIVDHFAGAKVLGVTATPDRGDKRAMGIVFESVAYSFDIERGIDQGYLVPILGQREEIEEIDLTGVTKSAGDLAVQQLDDVMVRAVEAVVKRTTEVNEHEKRQAICFFPGIKSAELACMRFNELEPNTAIFIHAKTDEDERKQLVRDFGRGKYRYFCNVGIATEGFDAPAVSLVVLARPTLSRSLFAQMVGRGTRILHGVIDGAHGKDMADLRRSLIADCGKPNSMVLDFVGNSGKHSLVSITDILGGSYSEAEVKRAKKKAEGKDGQGKNPQELLEQARAELQAIARAIKSKVKTKSETFDPFKVMHMDGEGVMPSVGYTPLSQNLRHALLNYGLTQGELQGMSQHDGQRFVSAQKARHAAGLATYKQLKYMQKFGVNHINIKKDRASAVITYIQNKRGQNLNPKAIDAIVHYKRQPGDDA